MARRILDTLQSFTIGQVAQLLAEETGDWSDLIERKLIDAAHKASHDPNSDDVELRIGLAPANARLTELPAAERDYLIREFEKRLYAQIGGLYVDHRGEVITSETSVRRTALEVWFEQEGFELPDFLKPTKDELGARVHAWLRERIRAVREGDEARRRKADYRAAAVKEFTSQLSERAFNRIWDNTVPCDWKRGGRPKKPKHSKQV